jgi:hypothetical protein
MEMYRFSSSKVPLFRPTDVAFRPQMYCNPGKNSEPGLYTRILRRSYQCPLVLFAEVFTQSRPSSALWGCKRKNPVTESPLSDRKTVAFHLKRYCFSTAEVLLSRQYSTIPRGNDNNSA